MDPVTSSSSTPNPTSVATIRGWLQDRFTAAIAAAGMNVPSLGPGGATVPAVVVEYGHPGRDLPPQFVSVGNLVAAAQYSNVTMPAQPRGSAREEYDLEVVVWVQDGGSYGSSAQRIVSERAWAISDVLHRDLRSDVNARHAGGSVVQCYFSSWADLDVYGDKGRAEQLLGTVHVMNRV